MKMVKILYPEARSVSESVVIGWARDFVATEAMREYGRMMPDAVAQEAIRMATEEVPDLESAIRILEDAGEVTFRK